MSEWFESKIQFLRQIENGLVKKITEQYLVNAMSFTECEARVTKEVGEGMREVTMMTEKRSNIKEVVFYGDTDLWHKCKVCYILMDEDTEKEKKITTYILVNAADLREAYDRCAEHLKEMIVPFTIPEIKESPIIDVYDYQQPLRPKAFEDKAQDLRNEAEVSSVTLTHVRADGSEKSVTLGPGFRANANAAMLHRTADPTDGQAHGFGMEERDDDDTKEDGEDEEECAMDSDTASTASRSLTQMLIDFGLDRLALWQIEEIKHAAASQQLPEFLGWMDVNHGSLSDDQATEIYEWCANDRADTSFARQTEID